MALVLSAGRAEEDPSTGIRLLSDIKQVFEEKRADRLTTSELLLALHQMETSPWGEEPKLSARRLAKLLRNYGIQPGHWRESRGYEKASFQDAWNRYTVTLSSEMHSEVSQASPSFIHAGLRPFSKCHTKASVTLSKMPENPVSMRVVTHVTDQDALFRERTEMCYRWRLPGGNWRDLISHPPLPLQYFEKHYPEAQANEALAALVQLEWEPRVPPCLEFAARQREVTYECALLQA